MVLLRRFFTTRGVLLVMKTFEDERYVVIKAYKCTVSEIWRDSFVLAYNYRVYVISLHTESTDSVIHCLALKQQLWQPFISRIARSAAACTST